MKINLTFFIFISIRKKKCFGQENCLCQDIRLSQEKGRFNDVWFVQDKWLGRDNHLLKVNNEIWLFIIAFDFVSIFFNKDKKKHLL